MTAHAATVLVSTQLELDAAIRAARAGDTSALRNLYGRHQGRLLNFVASAMEPALRAKVTPEDVLQDTLLESARGIDRYDPEKGSSFYSWLVGIAKHKISESRRAQGARKRAMVGSLDGSKKADVVSEQTSPSGGAVRNERRGRLLDALADLPERQGEAIRLRYLEGLSVAETGQRLDASESAIKSLVSRGMAELGRKLA
jgi:RNA polymerase sigma-70 factor (ECF subfamily)